MTFVVENMDILELFMVLKNQSGLIIGGLEKRLNITNYEIMNISFKKSHLKLDFIDVENSTFCCR